MAGKFHHEEIYRGREWSEKLAEAKLTICGAGALGSNLSDNLVRQGAGKVSVIDCDRIEEHNVSTQLYGESDIGAWKVDVLRTRLFKAAGTEVQAVRRELDEKNAKKLLSGADVVVDTFDNSASRRLVKEECLKAQTMCLHVGLNADYGEVVWNEHYRVPGDEGVEVCDYPLARNLILLTVAVASETLLSFLMHGHRDNWSVTLGDFAVRPLEI